MYQIDVQQLDNVVKCRLFPIVLLVYKLLKLIILQFKADILLNSKQGINLANFSAL